MWRLFLAAGRLREAMRWDAVHVSTRCTTYPTRNDDEPRVSE